MQVLFTRQDYPTNLFLAEDWRKFARATGKNSIKAAQRLYAASKGGALYQRADDSLVVLTKRSNGKICQKTYKPGQWGWAD